MVNIDETYSSRLGESKDGGGVDAFTKDLVYGGAEVRVDDKACLVSAFVFLNQLLDFLFCECKV